MKDKLLGIVLLPLAMILAGYIAMISLLGMTVCRVETLCRRLKRKTSLRL